MRISEVTRRAVFDVLTLEEAHWSGRLDEPEFLGRIWNLEQLPSTDGRFRNAAGDVWQHRVNNYDWDDDWIFHDSRFALLRCDDEMFLRFLCETIHPVVRPDEAEVQRLRQSYNDLLKADGFTIVEQGRVSNRSVYVARFVGTLGTPGVGAAQDVLTPLDTVYVSRQIARMENAVADDPALAIGTAKELVETCCHAIIAERGGRPSPRADLGELVKQVAALLRLSPGAVPTNAKAVSTIRRLLSNLGQIVQGLAELRNQYGTGHGRHPGRRGLDSRHARLAVGAASTLAVFLVETHKARPPEHSDSG